jgi:uncharacterized protein YktA (UPF0223 family)
MSTMKQKARQWDMLQRDIQRGDAKIVRSHVERVGRLYERFEGVSGYTHYHLLQRIQAAQLQTRDMQARYEHLMKHVADAYRMEIRPIYIEKPAPPTETPRD